MRPEIRNMAEEAGNRAVSKVQLKTRVYYQRRRGPPRDKGKQSDDASF